MKIVLATRNRGKILELRKLVGPDVLKDVELLTLTDLPATPEPREVGKTFQENARIKGLAYAEIHKVLCIADDSGVAVDVLGGRPGVLSSRFGGAEATDEQRNLYLVEELSHYPKPWKAAFVCAAVAALPKRVIAEGAGRVEGEIVQVPRGTEGFGYDPIFLVAGTGKTMAELSPDEKNRISHRGQALRLLAEELRQSGVLG